MSIERTIIATEEAPGAVGPYSQGIAADGFVFTAGQVPIKPASGKVEAETIEDQTRQVLTNVDAVLARRRQRSRPGGQDDGLYDRSGRFPGHERGLCRVLPGQPAGALGGAGRRPAAGSAGGDGSGSPDGLISNFEFRISNFRNRAPVVASAWGR